MGFTRKLFRRKDDRKPAEPAPCPDCGATVEPVEFFCPQCGVKIRPTPGERVESIKREFARRARLSLRQKIVTGRTWILIAAILALFQCVHLFGFLSTIDQRMAGFESRLASGDAVEREEVMRDFEEKWDISWVDARRMRTGFVVQRTAYLLLGIVYFGLYLWSARNAFPAALIAFFIFLTVATFQVIVNTGNFLMLNSLIIHVLMFAGLASAVSSAFRYRRLYARPAPVPPTAP